MYVADKRCSTLLKHCNIGSCNKEESCTASGRITFMHAFSAHTKLRPFNRSFWFKGEDTHS